MSKVGTVGASYVLIIEWLFAKDPKTGTDLFNVLKSRGTAAEHVICQSGQDVLDALSAADLLLQVNGKYPVIHLEAHGALDAEETPIGICGPSIHGHSEVLSWETLSPYLRVINVGTGFNLVVVGAACYGITAYTTFDVTNVAPFVLAIGFSEAILASSLRRVISELYRGLFSSSKTNIADIIDDANRERLEDDIATLRCMTCLDLGKALAVQAALEEWNESNEEREAHISRLLDRARETDPSKTREEVITWQKNYGPTAMQMVIDKWFAYDLIPENRERFSIDASEIYEALEKRKEVRS
jgi:hypothetical protein